MNTSRIPTVELLIVGFKVNDTALLKQLTDQFARAVTELRRRDSRFGITLKVSGQVLNVITTAPTQDEVTVLSKKVKDYLAEVSKPTRKQPTSHREVGQARAMILKALGAQPGRKLTKLELAEELELTYDLVHVNVNRLVALGFVKEAGKKRPTSDKRRPSKLYRLVAGDPQT